MNLFPFLVFRCSSPLRSFALFHHDLQKRDSSIAPFPALETVKTYLTGKPEEIKITPGSLTCCQQSVACLDLAVNAVVTLASFLAHAQPQLYPANDIKSLHVYPIFLHRNYFSKHASKEISQLGLVDPSLLLIVRFNYKTS